MCNINRYEIITVQLHQPDGEYVLYSDHIEIFERLQEKIVLLETKIEMLEEEMS